MDIIRNKILLVKNKKYNIYVSIIYNLISGLIKMMIAFLSLSFFLLINSFYNFSMAFAKIVALYHDQKSKKEADENQPNGYGFHQYIAYRNVGVAIICSGIFYLAYCVSIFLGYQEVSFNTIIAIAIATLSFSEIGCAFYGIIKSHNIKTPFSSAMSMINLCSGFISLVLTQSALLSLSHTANTNIPNGILGVIFSTITILIGLYMMLHICHLQSHKHIHAMERFIHKQVAKEVKFKILTFQDYGPEQRYLSIFTTDTMLFTPTIQAKIDKKFNIKLIFIKDKEGS